MIEFGSGVTDDVGQPGVFDPVIGDRDFAAKAAPVGKVHQPNHARLECRDFRFQIGDSGINDQIGWFSGQRINAASRGEQEPETKGRHPDRNASNDTMDTHSDSKE